MFRYPRAPSLYLFAILAAAASLSAQAAETAYPNRPIRFICPYPPGGATDPTARMFGAWLSERLGGNVVVDNRPGAGATLGHGLAAHATPDGYTLLLGTSGGLVVGPAYGTQVNYDPVKDFAPIARLGTISFMIMVRPDFPAKNLKEFLAHAKANPGKLSAGYGSAGSQVSQAMLRSMGGIDFVDVPYKGLPQAITDVLGGSIHFTFADLANALAQIKGGKLRGLAVTSRKRSPLAPDVPATLQRHHETFRAMLQVNLTVLATAHAVSEGIVRGVGSELQQKRSPSTYNAYGNRNAPSAGHATPLTVSRLL